MERKMVCLGHPQLISMHEIDSCGKQASHMAKHYIPADRHALQKQVRSCKNRQILLMHDQMGLRNRVG
jgi:hypothetical protein